MIGKKIEKALNEQLNFETHSAYVYWSMSAALEEMNFPGFAHWMRIQAMEEIGHADKIYRHIIDRGGRVILQAIDAPASEWKSVLPVFEDALAHEQKVTERINSLMDLSVQEKDHATQVFLQWFVGEQVEEEATLQLIIDKLALSEEAKGALFMLDRELGGRQGASNG